MSPYSRKLWESTSEPERPFESIARSAIDSKQLAAGSAQPVRYCDLLRQTPDAKFLIARCQL